jgi:hypothetical protein
MDDFKPQAHGIRVKGHDTSDLSIRGVVISLVVLAVAGLFSLLLMRLFLVPLQKFEEWEYPVQLTDSQKMMKMERAGPDNLARLKSEGEGEVGRIPESYSREDLEKHLAKTFPVPRLQYDDEAEMQLFRASEEKWLAGTGRDAAGNIHIPVDHEIDLVVERGLPQVSGPFVPPTLPSAVPMVPAPAPARR